MTPAGEDRLNIRLARLDDAAAIAEVHRSHVARWYRQVGEAQFDVGYGALTLDERCGLGGPWVSPETCAIHLNNLLLHRHTPIVAEAAGGVAAEMELFVGREGPAYRKNCHIGLLYVHRALQGRGIGRALIGRAARHAREQRCDTLTVASRLENEEFYRRCGFSFNDTLVEAEATPGEYLVDRSPLAYHLFEMADACALPSWAGCQRTSRFLGVNGQPSLLSYTSRPGGATEVSAWSAGADAGDLAFAALADLHAEGPQPARMLMPRRDVERLAGAVDVRLIGSRRTLVMRL